MNANTEGAYLNYYDKYRFRTYGTKSNGGALSTYRHEVFLSNTTLTLLTGK